MEVWREVGGFEGLYEVSDRGRVRGLVSGAIKQPHLGSNGYLVVRLFKGNVMYPRLVHRLVALAFLPKDPNRPHVNHIDADKTNATVENLEWVTPKENTQHAKRLGLLRNSPGVGRHHFRGRVIGEKQWAAKLDEEKVREIRRRKSAGEATKLIAADYGVSRSTVNEIHNRQKWAHVS